MPPTWPGARPASILLPVNQARTLVTDLAVDQVMTLIAVGPARRCSPADRRQDFLRAAIDKAQPTQAPATGPLRWRWPGPASPGARGASIVVISDGGFPADVPPLSVPVRYLKVGAQGSNLAISALAMRASGESPQLFAAVTNYADQPADAILSLTVDGELQSANRVSVPPGGTSNLTITDLPSSARVVKAEISAPAEGSVRDYLPVDDTAYAVFAAARHRARAAGHGGQPVHAAGAQLAAQRRSLPRQPGDLPQDQKFDLIVLDGWLPEELPATNLLIINPPSASTLFTVGETFETNGFPRQADDPVLTYVDFRSAIREAELVQTPGWARPLVEAEGGPLLLAGTADNRRVAILTFDLHASDLPLKIAFRS